MTLFDTYVMVDWSASNNRAGGKPKSDAIWWAVVHRYGSLYSESYVRYERTRMEASRHISDFLSTELTGRRRVLIGFDFAFGYPYGFARSVTGKAQARELWCWLRNEIDDKQESEGRNNRFRVAENMNTRFCGDGPFWSHPGDADAYALIPKAEPSSSASLIHSVVSRAGVRCECSDRRWPPTHPPFHRLTECFAFAQESKPRPVWQLFFPPGAVGSQVLMGLPYLWDLVHDRRFMNRTEVWPFRGMRAPDTANADTRIVIAEIYPSLLRNAIARLKPAGEILDRAQVRMTALALARMDGLERLERLFGPVGSVDGAPLAEEEKRRVENEEGWILGVGFNVELSNALSEALKPTKPKDAKK